MVWIGSKIGCKKEIKTNKKLLWLKSPTFKILGIEYNLAEENIIYSNYENKLKAVKNLLNTWSWRNLTICGKVTVIKSLAIPKIVHLFRSLPCPGEEYFKKLDSIMFSFIWNDKPDKIKRSVLINNIESGGVKQTHFSKSLKVFWIKKVLDPTYQTDWKTLFLDKISKFGGNLLWYLHPDSLKDIAQEFNPFWKNIIEIWAELNKDNYEDTDYLSRPIWYNPNIKIGNNFIFWNNISEAGVNFINDLIDEDGEFLSYEEFVNAYNIRIDFLNYAALIHAIPIEWKNKINEEETKLEEIQNFWVDKIKKQNSNKYAYDSLSAKFKERPEKSENKWKIEFNNDDINFDDIYFTNFRALAKDSTLRAFQYKILNRILATNRLLFKMNISAYDLCTFCATHSESIEHLFWECMISKNVWFFIYEKLNLKNFIPDLVFDKKTILFGYLGDNQLWKQINLFIVIIKYYIYKARLDLKEPSVHDLKSYVSFLIRIHKEIYKELDFPFMRGLVDL